MKTAAMATVGSSLPEGESSGQTSEAKPTRPRRVYEAAPGETGFEKEKWAERGPLKRDIIFSSLSPTDRENNNITGPDVDLVLGYLVSRKRLDWGGRGKKPWVNRFASKASSALREFQSDAITAVSESVRNDATAFGIKANGDLDAATRGYLNFLFDSFKDDPARRVRPIQEVVDATMIKAPKTTTKPSPTLHH